MSESIHSGHRQRLKERFLRDGLDRFDAHNVLELLLFYAVQQRDTNALAHRLINTFGSLPAVLDAPYAELLRVPGVGEHTAVLLKMMPELARRYMTEERGDVYLNTSEKAGAYLMPYYLGRHHECVFVTCCDAKCKVLCTRMLFEGNVNSSQVNIRRIIETAFACDATGIILSHNHPGGVALPSTEDLQTTRHIRDALNAVGLLFMDHLIIADGDFVSLSDSGYLPE